MEPYLPGDVESYIRILYLCIQHWKAYKVLVERIRACNQMASVKCIRIVWDNSFIHEILFVGVHRSSKRPPFISRAHREKLGYYTVCTSLPLSDKEKGDMSLCATQEKNYCLSVRGTGKNVVVILLNPFILRNILDVLL